MGKLNAEYKIKNEKKLEEAKTEAFQNYCIQYFNQIRDKIEYELTTTTKEDGNQYIICSAYLPVISPRIKADNKNTQQEEPPTTINDNTFEEVLTSEEKIKELKVKEEKIKEEKIK